MKNLLFFLAVFVPILSHSQSFYSVINSHALIGGTSDCWLINYSIFNTMGTTNPLDDVNIGTKDCVVGTDCPIAPPHVDDSPVVAISPTQENLEVFPNPTTESININLPTSTNGRNLKWSITSLTDGRTLTGTFDGFGTLNISTANLRNGNYFFSFLGKDQILGTAKFTVLH